MKKYIAWDVFHLSLILSLLRLYPELYRSSDLQNLEPLGREEILGPSSAYTQTNFHHNLNNRLHGYIHPKNFDDSIARTLFINDLNSLINRPYWEVNPPENNIYAYILNDQLPLSSVDQSANNNRTTTDSESLGVTNQSQLLGYSENNTAESELTQEDMDLIEILWKQDIDLGISRDVFDGSWNAENHKSEEQLHKDKSIKLKSEELTVNESDHLPNPWDGLTYSIDSETGEHTILPPNNGSSQSFQEVPSDDLDNVSLEEALQFFENDIRASLPNTKLIENPTSSLEASYLANIEQPFHQPKLDENITSVSSNVLPALPLTVDSFDLDEGNNPLLDQLREISDLALEARALNETPNSWPLNSLYNTNESVNSVGIGASNIDFSGALLRNTTLPIHIDNNTNANDLIDEFLLSLMTNDSIPSDPVPPMTDEYNEIPADFLRDNFTSENDFLVNFLNDEGVLDLMEDEMAAVVSDNEKNSTLATQAQASNDSAISCFGSENEWQDDGITYQGVERNWNDRVNRKSEATSSSSSDSCHGLDNTMDIGTVYKEPKYIPHDGSSNGYSSDSGCEKKNYLHQRYDRTPLFGSASRYDDSGSASNTYSEMATSSSRLLHSVMHNHSYPKDSHEDDESNDQPFERDKKGADIKPGRRNPPESLDGSEGYHSSRDEKRARDLKLPLSPKEITTLPIDEFNERLTKFELSEEQLTLIRDIRRRGKNKIAAQNCRKRKMDQIFELQHTLEELEMERQKLSNEQSLMSRRRDFLQSKFNKLYQFICEIGPNPGPPDPPGYFPNRAPGAPRQAPNFPLVNNSTNFSNHENAGESKGHGGARVKRKVNKHN